jgi:hypothetical protein
MGQITKLPAAVAAAATRKNLGAIAYDPAGQVTKSLGALLAMTAFDTTNARITFTAPANGRVEWRVKVSRILDAGGADIAGILLGVLDGATVRARSACADYEYRGSGSGSVRSPIWAKGIISGLTPGNSYTFDAAYGVESAESGSDLVYGGPDDTTSNSASGALVFEIWEANDCLGAVAYDPASRVLKDLGTLLAMTAFDTTNARITFTAPASGKVRWREAVAFRPGASGSVIGLMLGVLDGATVRARQTADGLRTIPTGSAVGQYNLVYAEGIISGLTPGNSYTFDAAYSIKATAVAPDLAYGGPNNTTADDAAGALFFEIHEVAA